MGGLMDAITGRRSIRNYRNEEIPGEILEQVLEAVRWSPSWANTQCWEIIVVKDPGTKRKLQGIVGRRNPAFRAIVEAPIVLAVCGRLGCAGYYGGEATTTFGDWFMFDLGIATQNLCLAAHDLGLGTVIVGLFDHSQAMEILLVPEGCQLVALVPIGYPSRKPSAPARRKVAEFTHSERCQPSGPAGRHLL